MTDLSHLIPLAKIAKQIPSAVTTKSVNPSTVSRWVTRGVIGPSGERVKLAAVKLGSKFYVSESALSEFMSALRTSDSDMTSPTHRQTQAAQSAADLRAALSD